MMHAEYTPYADPNSASLQEIPTSYAAPPFHISLRKWLDGLVAFSAFSGLDLEDRQPQGCFNSCDSPHDRDSFRGVRFFSVEFYVA
jgi:hypothetical protein